ncbi:MAG: Gfo/Idh/MocA family protein [Candidatus Brocadiia bacterium]
MDQEQKSVAVVGASGIGKHHAKWWDFEGARVCGFVGTSSESVADTQDVLSDLFGYEGPGYTDLAELLEREHPDIVDVCTPPDCHFEHVLTAIGELKDTLCEKPFVYDEKSESEEILDKAKSLVSAADTAGVRLGMCSQYHVSARKCQELLGQNTDDAEVKKFRGQLASPVRDRAPNPVESWMDLAPHMLAGLQATVPGATINFRSLETSFSGYGAKASFTVDASNGTQVECEIVTNRTLPEKETSHIRRFELNGHTYDIGGGKNENGIYCAEIETDWGIFQYPDPLRLLIREFLTGTAVIDGAEALKNLTWLLRIADYNSQS